MGTSPFTRNGDQSSCSKSDVFGRVHRVGNVVVRDAASARPWARGSRVHLMRREHRALIASCAGRRHRRIPRASLLIHARSRAAGSKARPCRSRKPRDPAYFRAASRLLRRLHAANVIHNDLAKETNWLVTPDGRPALVDFQLAMTLTQRGALARALGHDDIRHLLKHKRTYLPEALTAREKRILAHAVAGLAGSGWPAARRPLSFVTRRIFHWRDREGAGDRDQLRRLKEQQRIPGAEDQRATQCVDPREHARSVHRPYEIAQTPRSNSSTTRCLAFAERHHGTWPRQTQRPPRATQADGRGNGYVAKTKNLHCCAWPPKHPYRQRAEREDEEESYGYEPAEVFLPVRERFLARQCHQTARNPCQDVLHEHTRREVLHRIDDLAAPAFQVVSGDGAGPA